MSLEIKVIPTMDSKSVDTRMFDDVPLWDKDVPNEIEPPLPPACFLGAWYRKVLSSYDYWLGLEGVVELGEFTPDEERFNLDGNGRYMDNPSVYVGGNSLQESDCGLGYNLMYTSDDTSYELTLASPKLGYRPFWRYIYNDATDIDNNVTRRSVNSWNLSNPKSLQYYYFPGDVVRIKVYSPIKDYLQLRIEVVKPTTNPKYIAIREKLNLVNGTPDTFYSPLFYSKGHGYEKAEFKRVNSIDQYGNEGYHAKLTDASVSRSVWHETFLYRMIDGKIYKVPFGVKRQASMICPSTDAITVELLNENGSEAVTLHPGVVKAKEKK